MIMIYFTSDLHLGHNAVINMQNRPFTDADEMDTMVTFIPMDSIT